MDKPAKRWGYAVWLTLIAIFAALHALHLRADFPNHSPWSMDWAKYTDEGWYGNAAVRTHLLGTWYLPGDFNPAVAVPVWPFMEWLWFFATGVAVQSARALAVGVFFANLLLSYFLLRMSGPRWMALLALTLMVTSPFLYCFSRLAILEPALTLFTLAALNVAVRLPRMQRKMWGAAVVGVFVALMVLTKTTAIFLLPAVAWAVATPLRARRATALRCMLIAGAALAAAYGLWMGMVVRFGLLADYQYYFFINHYPRPKEFYWPVMSLWWSIHGALWIDKLLVPLAGAIIVGALLARRKTWARELLLDPVFGASVLAAGGYVLFMTYQDHPQPRYFEFVAVFCFFIVAQGVRTMLTSFDVLRRIPLSRLGWAVVGLVAWAACVNAIQTVRYAMHPEYTFVNAAEQLARYIDTHPNGKRMLVSVSGDEIMLMTHLPALCDDFGTMELPARLEVYRPGWFAAWNDLDPGTLDDLHARFSVEQVATFRAFDDPERNVLVLFKLHPLASGKVRDSGDEDLKTELPGDSFDVPIQ